MLDQVNIGSSRFRSSTEAVPRSRVAHHKMYGNTNRKLRMQQEELCYGLKQRP